MSSLSISKIETWNDLLKEESKKDYFKEIIARVQKDAKETEIYPPHKEIFNAFNYCPLNKVSCVILGQDPYHGLGQAHGLSFSVPKGIAIPPSLRNIFKELKENLGYDPPESGCLIPWAQQGVLLLNSVLTVRKNEPASHKNIGWDIFTDTVISYLNELKRPLVFMLWGAFAKGKEHLITNEKHLILKAAHPSPFSASNFFGCKHFSKCNGFLIDNESTPINWKLE